MIRRTRKRGGAGNFPAPSASLRSDPAFLELKGLSKSFDGRAMAVDNVDLAVQPGEFMSLLGSSGCGKTTTLRMIAGFEQPTSGEIELEGSPLIRVPPHRRPINTVFQDYALFPHLDVRKNIEFGLRATRVSDDEIATRVDGALEMVQLADLGRRAPSQLSGGQRQRVALARALVMRPRVLLLDEPLGALDLKLRKQMRVVLKRLCHELGITFIYVTHDQEEALAMSDRIAVMRDGRLEQCGTPRALYDEPATLLVADFVGDNNLLAGQLNGVRDGRATVDVQGTRVEADASSLNGCKPGDDVVLAVRPEHLALSDGHEQSVGILGQVIESVFGGSEWRVSVRTGSGDEMVVALPSDRAPHIMRDQPVTVAVGHAARVFPAAPGEPAP